MTMINLQLCVILLAAISLTNCELHGNDAVNVLDVCLDSKNHKERPGPNDNLYKCDQWRNRSCCTNETAEAVEIDGTHLYNLNYHHCTNMSSKCLRQFEKNLCFYECSPNLGPWLIPVKSSYRKQRYKNVPLCKNDCELWWNDCNMDQTCVADWSRGFNWTGGVNHCPSDSTCQTFSDVFHNATYFCEHIFGPYDYKVVDGNTNCMKFTFDGKNPNTKVAETYAKNMGLLSKHEATVPNIPPYVPPSPTPLLEVHGTLASIVMAILILVAVAGVLAFFGVRKFRRGGFQHQGMPVQFPSIVSSRIIKHAARNSRQDDRDAEMSFMQFEEEEEDDEQSPEMNGTLRMEL